MDLAGPERLVLDLVPSRLYRVLVSKEHPLVDPSYLESLGPSPTDSMKTEAGPFPTRMHHLRFATVGTLPPAIALSEQPMLQVLLG